MRGGGGSLLEGRWERRKRPRAEEGGTHADQGCALGDGDGVVRAHTHGEAAYIRRTIILQVASDVNKKFSEMLKEGAAVLGAWYGGRDRHQALEAQAGQLGAAAGGSREVDWVEAGLGRFAGDIDFEEDVLDDAEFFGLGVDSLEQFQRGDGLDQVDAAHDELDFIGLEVSDKVDGGAVVGEVVQVGGQFLDSVFAAGRDTGGDSGADRLRGLGFGRGDEGDGAWWSACGQLSGGDLGADGGDIFGEGH